MIHHPYKISRRIEIDAGHRVPDHRSKCKNVHGHRYVVDAVCESVKLHSAGEQTGMVLDFGFLKDEMVKHIDHHCDHGLILWYKDPIVNNLLTTPDLLTVLSEVEVHGNTLLEGEQFTIVGKLYLVTFVPTAENLAKHWYEVLKPRVQARSNGLAKLTKVVVHETPNCVASYAEQS